jgi:hypothetical protein
MPPWLYLHLAPEVAALLFRIGCVNGCLESMDTFGRISGLLVICLSAHVTLHVMLLFGYGYEIPIPEYDVVGDFQPEFQSESP